MLEPKTVQICLFLYSLKGIKGMDIEAKKQLVFKYAEDIRECYAMVEMYDKLRIQATHELKQALRPTEFKAFMNEYQQRKDRD
jgi:hypothetical protein